MSTERKKGNITDKSYDTMVTASSMQYKAPPPKSDQETVVLRCYYDLQNRLTEAHLVQVPHVPRILMKVLTFYAPIYKNLNKIVIKDCGIDVYTIRELGKQLACSTLTDVCLDGSTLPQGNYAVLLDLPAKVKNLSLCRCKINDEICKQIASKLEQSAITAVKTLQLLNLTSNQITDEGAKYLGIALRSNRTLRYLNLSGNRLTDEGAGYIFDILERFPLTYQENISRRQWKLQYFKDYILNSFSQPTEKDNKSETASLKKKKRSISSAKKISLRKMSVINDSTQQDELMNDIMGSCAFNTKNVEIRDGIMYCLGNTSLCYLNLAYNNLAFPSLNKLLNVLKHQNDIPLIPEAGLFKVVLEGNYLPKNCYELNKINEYFVNKQYKRDPRKLKRGSIKFGSSSRIIV